MLNWNQKVVYKDYKITRLTISFSRPVADKGTLPLNIQRARGRWTSRSKMNAGFILDIEKRFFYVTWSGPTLLYYYNDYPYQSRKLRLQFPKGRL